MIKNSSGNAKYIMLMGIFAMTIPLQSVMHSNENKSILVNKKIMWSDTPTKKAIFSFILETQKTYRLSCKEKLLWD